MHWMCREWLSQLRWDLSCVSPHPPGVTHLIKQHLNREHDVAVNMEGITVIKKKNGFFFLTLGFNKVLQLTTCPIRAKCMKSPLK